MSLPDEPKRLTPKLGKDKERISDLQEKRTAAKLKYNRTIASGAIGTKGDLTSRNTRHALRKDSMNECKVTDNETLPVEKKWLIKLYREARERNMNPEFTFGFNTMPAGTPKDWIAVPVDRFQELKEIEEKYLCEWASKLRDIDSDDPHV